MQKLKVLIGAVRLLYHLSFRKNQKVLNEIVEELSSRKNYEKGRTFVLMMGFSKSGKETLIKNHPVLKNYFRVSSDKIHEQLNRRFDFMVDDNTVGGKAYWERQLFTRLLRQQILKKVFEQNLCVVSDSANLRRDERKSRLNLAERYGYTTVIIHVECFETVLLDRLREADALSEKSGGLRVWVDLYEKVQKPRFEIPLSSEADTLLHYRSDAGTEPKSLIIPN